VVGIYVHVPFCARRCGYCDFNTYVLGAGGLTPRGWIDALHAELDWHARRLAGFGPVDTVFFGGGTPTLLGDGLLSEVLDAIRQVCGLTSGAEVTVEANPETVSQPLLEGLLTSGVNRLSLGMQSSDENVLTTLDRLHTPGQATLCVEEAHQAGFTDVSVDLIYGTPGESLESWRSSLLAALAVAPEHVSCYALIVEPGTPLARRIGRGELPVPDDDLMADEYLMADDLLTEAGLGWYELSNWARRGHECRHNLGYWRSDDWIGVGPGAHSHVGQRRWWDHKSPAKWAATVAHGSSPEAGHEIVDDDIAHEERILLELRLAAGLPLDILTPTEYARVPALVGDGLLAQIGDRIVLTRQGRLLADKVTRDLLD